MKLRSYSGPEVKINWRQIKAINEKCKTRQKREYRLMCISLKRKKKGGGLSRYKNKGSNSLEQDCKA